jgi:hypothetical protein
LTGRHPGAKLPIRMASSCRNQPTTRFQLAKVRLTDISRLC